MKFQVSIRANKHVSIHSHIYYAKGVLKLRKNYNPYLLPPWLRKIRFFMKHCIIPITVFQAIRTIFLPTTLDIIVLFILILFSYLLTTDFI